MGGPLGALAGYVIGSLFDGSSNSDNSSSWIGGGGSYGNSADEESYRQAQGQRNSFLFSLLVLATYIIRADGRVMHSEMEYVRRFLRDNFGEDAVGLNVSEVLPSRSGIEIGNPGTDPWHTPWDGCWGIASATSNTFVSTAGSVVVVSHDGTETFEQDTRH